MQDIWVSDPICLEVGMSRYFYEALHFRISPRQCIAGCHHAIIDILKIVVHNVDTNHLVWRLTTNITITIKIKTWNGLLSKIKNIVSKGCFSSLQESQTDKCDLTRQETREVALSALRTEMACYVKIKICNFFAGQPEAIIGVESLAKNWAHP